MKDAEAWELVLLSAEFVPPVPLCTEFDADWQALVINVGGDLAVRLKFDRAQIGRLAERARNDTTQRLQEVDPRVRGALLSLALMAAWAHHRDKSAHVTCGSPTQKIFDMRRAAVFGRAEKLTHVGVQQSLAGCRKSATGQYRR